MYINPNSTIRLLRRVPIDPNQNDTLYFASVSEQTSYFIPKTVHIFTEQTYQRTQRGYCRLDIPTDQCYDINYMMYQNTAYGDKWFYAFVNSVEYINDNCTEIKFTIDPIQSWFFEYEVDQCLIERTTTDRDRIGEHIEPEPVECGEYTLNNYSNVGSAFNNYRIILMFASDETTGHMYDGIYGGCSLTAFHPTEDLDLLNAEIRLAVELNKGDGIVGMYMCPSEAVGGARGGAVVPSRTAYASTEYGTSISKNDTLDGYKPRNMKMYTYPYNYYHLDSPTGSLALRYELFNGLTPKLHITCNSMYPVEIVCSPLDYKGSGSVLSEYRPEKLVINGFPMCSWTTDAFSEWLAQNSAPAFFNAVGSVGSSRYDTTNYTISTGIQRVANLLGQGYVASTMADHMHGSFTNGSNDFSYYRKHFKGGRMSILNNYAKRIDDYFTMFGYAIGRVQTPARYNRTRFTYIKTVGCNVNGALPSDDAKYIADCYDRGIRFWKDHTNVGNYVLDNEPLNN